MTDIADKLAELERLFAKATMGPWTRESDSETSWACFLCGKDGQATGEVYPNNGENDAALIIFLVNEARALLRRAAQVEEVLKKCDALAIAALINTTSERAQVIQDALDDVLGIARAALSPPGDER
jgi:hypothetical protein